MSDSVQALQRRLDIAKRRERADRKARALRAAAARLAISGRHAASLEAHVYPSFGRLLRRLRIDRGLSQEQLAHAIGMVRASVSNIESGRQRIMLHTVYELADALGVKPRDLLTTRPR